MAMLMERHVPLHAAVVWVDGWHALVAHRVNGRPTVTEVDREADPAHDYLVRVAKEAEDCDRLMILGPGVSVLAFEAEYETLYRRPQRFVEAETAASADERELLARFHLLDPDERRS
jgi:hypothetical protein